MSSSIQLVPQHRTITISQSGNSNIIDIMVSTDFLGNGFPVKEQRFFESKIEDSPDNKIASCIEMLLGMINEMIMKDSSKLPIEELIGNNDDPVKTRIQSALGDTGAT